MYSIGDIIITDTKNITITDISFKKQKDGSRKTVYKYICNICGFDCNDMYRGGKYVPEMWFTEYQLKHNKMCTCCASKVVKSGINSIATTHKELVKYFYDQCDADKYCYLSNKVVRMKCPNCGTDKYMKISDFYNQGIACPRCSDGISMGEKVVYILLKDNDIGFIKEYKINGAEYRYDFYIPSVNMIIETNGKQHYEETHIYRDNKTFDDEVKNDINKKNFALNNGIEKYIYIDCRESNIDYIMNSIYQSNIINLLHINNINVDSIRCDVYSQSMTKDICNIYNSCDNLSIKAISDIMHYSKTTIRKHLKIGAELGWCDYSVETYKKTPHFRNNTNVKN